MRRPRRTHKADTLNIFNKLRNDFKDQKEHSKLQLIRRQLVIYVGVNIFYLAAAPSIMRFVTSSIINEFSCIHFKSRMEVYIGRIQARGYFGSSWRPSAETEMDLLTAAFLFEPNRLSSLCQLYLISFISSFFVNVVWLSSCAVYFICIILILA